MKLEWNRGGQSGGSGGGGLVEKKWQKRFGGNSSGVVFLWGLFLPPSCSRGPPQ